MIKLDWKELTLLKNLVKKEIDHLNNIIEQPSESDPRKVSQRQDAAFGLLLFEPLEESLKKMIELEEKTMIQNR